jgi:hypothetical protein
VQAGARPKSWSTLKKLAAAKVKKPLDAVEICDTLDRASNKGPLRPAQEAMLREWHGQRTETRDLLIKLQARQGKTVIGFLNRRISAGWAQPN